MAGPRFEDIAEGKGAECGIAARAATCDHQPLAIDFVLGDQVERAMGAIINIDNTPLIVEPLAIGATITRTATIVDINRELAWIDGCRTATLQTFKLARA